MRYFKLILLAVTSLVIGVSAWAWTRAGREAGPSITITSPERYIGRATTVSVTIDSATPLAGTLLSVEQNGRPLPLSAVKTERTSDTRTVMAATVGASGQPLTNGPATLVVSAGRRVLFGLRTVHSQAQRDLIVRIDPPKVAVVSLHHYINVGGAEFVVLRATPEDVEAGIQVGDARYPAYPGSAVGLTDPAVRVGFFALRHDQDVASPISAFARDAAGNEVVTPIDHRPFPRRFLASSIPIDQRFLDRVVPAIASQTPDLKVDSGSAEGLLKGFLEINGNLRAKNNAAITALAGRTALKMLWTEAFAQMGNSQVESRFADRRTYFFNGMEIDRQVHLGFDLASVQRAPVRASNTGVVLFADYLGIYGNCVIVDHGLGVQSLYAHLSTIAVKPGDAVAKGEEFGRTGATGLAGGDHLHFTVLLQGTPVNPIEWWDPKWMQDRVFRKITEAGGRAD
jgi:murein DD-endopeptidase MepM/ murein hydrolase activator NlpD